MKNGVLLKDAVCRGDNPSVADDRASAAEASGQPTLLPQVDGPRPRTFDGLFPTYEEFNWKVKKKLNESWMFEIDEEKSSTCPVVGKTIRYTTTHQRYGHRSGCWPEMISRWRRVGHRPERRRRQWPPNKARPLQPLTSFPKSSRPNCRKKKGKARSC